MAILAKLRSSDGFTIVAIGFAVFTDVFLFGMVIPVLPFSLHDRIGIPKSEIQHLIGILLFLFGVTNIIGSPIVGMIGDHFNSRRLPFLLGLLILFLAIVCFWAATSIFTLVVARLLQGFSTPIVWVSGLSIILDKFHGKALGNAMSYMTLAEVTGKVISPTIGGIAYDYSGYDSVFIIALSLIIFDVLLRFAMLDKTPSSSEHPTDPESEPLLREQSNREVSSDSADEHTTNSAAGMGPAKFDPSKVQPAQDSDSALSIMFALAKEKKLLIEVLAYALVQALFIAIDTILPLFLVNRYNFTAIGSGLAFIPVAAPALLAPLAGNLVDRVGPKWPCLFGFVLSIISFLGLFIVDVFPKIHIAFLYVALFVFGASHALQETSIMVQVSLTLDRIAITNPVVKKCGTKRATSHGFGLLGVAAGVGLTTGPLMSGEIAAKSTFGYACLFNAIVGGLGLLLELLTSNDSAPVET